MDKLQFLVLILYKHNQVSPEEEEDDYRMKHLQKRKVLSWNGSMC